MDSFDLNIDPDNSTSKDPGIDESILGGDGDNKSSSTDIDLDVIFGGTEGGDGNGDGTGHADDPFADLKKGSQKKSESKEDGSFDDGTFQRSPEEVARMFQSKYDKTAAEAQKLQERVKQYESLENFLNSVYEDNEVRQAFLYELAPESFKPKDPHAFIKEALAKEFGEDFKPDKDEAEIPGSRSWLYFKKADDLYTEAKQSGSKVPKTLKQIRAERDKKRKEQESEARRQKEKIVQKFGWDDTTFASYVDWANKVTPLSLATVWEYARKKGKTKPSSPNIAQQPGRPAAPDKYFRELNEFFG